MCHGDMATGIRAANDGLDPLDATQTIHVDDSLDSYGSRRKKSRVHINLCTLIQKSDRKKGSEITRTMSNLSSTKGSEITRTMSNLSSTKGSEITRTMSNLSSTHLTSCLGPGRGRGRGTYELISISWLLDAVSEHILPTDLSRYTICML